MDPLDFLYAQMLKVGFVVLDQAVAAREQDWIKAELELLHNVPSLLEEDNIERHRYFWFEERSHYMEWISTEGSEEAASRMRTFYEPIWNEMEPLVIDRIGQYDNQPGITAS